MISKSKEEALNAETLTVEACLGAIRHHPRGAVSLYLDNLEPGRRGQGKEGEEKLESPTLQQPLIRV